MDVLSPAPAWLADAVLYQIYPQSFADSGGDGIGDLPGAIGRLEYLQWLGVDTVWFSPLFASPFRDAGYDISDYLSVAPRYGDNDDLAELVEAARGRGIRVLLDLVPGHSSDQHPWFQASANDPGDDRYIWADTAEAPGPAWVASPGSRPGFYLPNFYPVQPALNFGYARTDPDEPWRQPTDAAGPQANLAALREIMAFWFDRGVAGFRCDMAFSLVKDDPDHSATGAVWRGLRTWMDAEYPDRALIAEWGDPKVSVPAGFDADFFLHFAGRPLLSLWGNAQGSHYVDWGTEPCYFAPEGLGSMREFLDAWQEADRIIDGAGQIVVPTANHDFSRLTCGTRTRDMVAPAFAFLLTWPTLPAIYYGDEIGMRYIPGLPDKEGSQLNTESRQGSRTPMQWDESANAGFSTADASQLYLPIDPAADRPTVATQRADDTSLLHTVRSLIRLRREHPELGTRGSVTVLTDGYPFVYTRADSFLIVVNPSARPEQFAVKGPIVGDALVAHGVTSTADGVLHTEPFSFAIFAISQG